MRLIGRSAEAKPAGRAPRASRALVPLILLLAGCRLFRADTRYDLLEAEIRTRDEQIERLQAEVGRTHLLNATLGRQPTGRADLPPDANCPPGLFQLSGRTPTVPLKDITLATGTGGVDEDNLPGDESFTVVVAPRDEDGTVVKVPMSAVVRAYEVTPAGLKHQIGQWDVSPEQMRKAWKSGLLSSGYFVPLQWDRLPTTGRVRVVARVATADGREFEADKEVRVKPLPGFGARPAAVPVPTIAPPGSGPVNELPPPGTTLPPRPKPGVVPLAPPAADLPARPEELPPPARLKFRG